MNNSERNRLEQVKEFLQLDFDSRQEYKDIVELASQLCKKPVSLITLLDEETNWIKAAEGIDIKESPRAISFCQYGILQDELTLIPDATKDPRFTNNPLVNDMNVRFYAGAPLILSNGYKLGTLCLFDFVPNELSDKQLKTLKMLSKQVVYLMELQMSQKKLAEQLEEIEAKNTALRQISQLQSHAIRQPLSSILGLVNLVKECKEEPDEQWLSMVEASANILDDKIHAIVNETMGDSDLKLLNFNKVVEEIEDYAIILLDKNGIIENWNRGAKKIKGYNTEEIVGHSFSTFYTEEDVMVGLPQKLLSVASRNGTARDTGWRVKKDGSIFWASVVITAIHDKDNEVIGYIKVTRDLSSLKEAQDSRDASELRYRKMIDEVDDYAIILLDIEGNIEYWNKGAQRIKGYKANEIIGKNFSIFYGEKDRDNKLPETLLQKANRDGKVHNEGWRIKKDGTKFWGSVIITAIHDNLGDVIGFVKVTKDQKND